MSTVFASKLDRLPDTIALCLAADVSGLAHALKKGARRLAIAIGSGGSAAAADYLAICRASLGDRTIVQTPMQFVLEQDDLRDQDIWVFSAKGENTDICAALTAARTRGAKNIFVVTSDRNGRLAREAEAANARVFACPVADPKDGFLATHSLLATVTVLLRASDQCATNLGQSVAAAFQEAAAASLSHATRTQLRSTFARLRKSDMLVLLIDPRLGPAATVLETSLWEAALLPVQRTDFRNFAHGRHVWLARNPDATFVVALTGILSAPAWSEIRQLAPPEIRTIAFDYESCGRFQNAIAMVEALTFIEAIGARLDVDPAKPGPGPYAAAMYGSDALLQLETKLDRPVRHKRSAFMRSNVPACAEPDFAAAYAQFRDRLASTVFHGLVLDYDGTIVTHEGRYLPPEPPLLDELVRLIEGGVRIGIATGRGGSVGEDLRANIPSQHHERVLVGYYNGSYIRTLDVDIREDPTPVSAELLKLSAWFAQRQAHFRTFAIKESGAQVSIAIADLHDPDALLVELGSSFPEVQWARSGHTIDFFARTASKADVVSLLAQHVEDEDAAILRIGDSGARYGNDHVLLGSYYGISVRQVCDRPDVCWSLFGHEPSGPAALLRVLKALISVGTGAFRLDFGRLRDSA
jgi:hydroxymethylpyrimidine pyrophosphatase-like HAD family hydrolase/D-arabinose 5-phosphate isomerase GutQ